MTSIDYIDLNGTPCCLDSEEEKLFYHYSRDLNQFISPQIISTSSHCFSVKIHTYLLHDEFHLIFRNKNYLSYPDFYSHSNNVRGVFYSHRNNV